MIRSISSFLLRMSSYLYNFKGGYVRKQKEDRKTEKWITLDIPQSGVHVITEAAKLHGMAPESYIIESIKGAVYFNLYHTFALPRSEWPADLCLCDSCKDFFVQEYIDATKDFNGLTSFEDIVSGIQQKSPY